MTLSGSASASTATDASGNYSFSGLTAGGNDTVTPSKSGYSFSPTSQVFNNLSANQTQNFAASVPPVGSDLAVGKPATQSSTIPYFATVAASNAVDGNTDGNFADGSVSHTNSEANAWWQVDLGASATISSVVVWNRTDCCGDRLSEYWVFISNTPFGATDTPATLQNRAGTWSGHQTSAPNPSTSIPAVATGRYVRIQLSGTNFLSLAEVQVFGSLSSQPTYSISGQVVLSGTSTGLSGALVTLSGGASGSTTTDASGNYSFSGLTSGGNYALTPSKSGYTFNPASQSVNNLSANQTQNFSAGARTYGITGQVTLSGSALSGVTMTLSGSASASTTTDASGNYSFSGLSAGGNDTVTPSKTGYTFSPTSQIFNNLSANQTQNFSATVIPVGSDLAVGKTATQSSTLPYFATVAASNAVDGNTDGNFADGSVSHTNQEANAWWQVDLGASASINSVVVWNRTDCCGDRLTDYWVFISNTPFGATDTPATLQNRAGTWSSHQTSAPNPSTSIPAGATGRYVRVQLSGNNFLSLAELQVMGTWASPSTYSISGQVTLSGSALSGVTMTLTGSASVMVTPLSALPDSVTWPEME